MRLVRTSTVLALIAASLAPASSLAADIPTEPGMVHVSGVVRPDRPFVRIDPISPWLLAQGSAPTRTPGVLLGPVIDPLSAWLVNDPIRDVWRWRGARFEGPVVLDDPRFIGWLSMVWNTDVHRQPGSFATVHAVAVRMEVGGGFWVGSLTGTGDAATGSFQLTGSLAGSGAFAGDSVVIDLRTVDTGWLVDLLVITGELPPPAAFVR